MLDHFQQPDSRHPGAASDLRATLPTDLAGPPSLDPCSVSLCRPIRRDHHEPLDARSGLRAEIRGDIALVVIEGELSVTTPGGRRALRAGQVLSLARGVAHDWRVTSLAARFSVIVAAEGEP
ncbi:hypothetical protein [Frigidibacter sp. MR17.24]|uniref:hypothetical protein n=1 Tax=Frigidibacter sp. MR17.24 TaxID=3127345 RepID=UPI0030131A5E